MCARERTKSSWPCGGVLPKAFEQFCFASVLLTQRAPCNRSFVAQVVCGDGAFAASQMSAFNFGSTRFLFFRVVFCRAGDYAHETNRFFVLFLCVSLAFFCRSLLGCISNIEPRGAKERTGALQTFHLQRFLLLPL